MSMSKDSRGEAQNFEMQINMIQKKKSIDNTLKPNIQIGNILLARNTNTMKKDDDEWKLKMSQYYKN